MKIDRQKKMCNLCYRLFNLEYAAEKGARVPLGKDMHIFCSCLIIYLQRVSASSSSARPLVYIPRKSLYSY